MQPNLVLPQGMKLPANEMVARAVRVCSGNAIADTVPFMRAPGLNPSRVGVSTVSAVVLSLLVFGCTDDGPVNTNDGVDGIGDGLDIGEDTAGDEESEDDGPTTGVKLDMPEESADEEELPCEEGEFCECDIPPHTPCDAEANTPIARAMGLNCDGELQVSLSTTGAAAGMGTRNAFGNLGAFPPQEGSRYVVMGSGPVADLDNNDIFSGACSGDLGAVDPGTLPPPLVGTNVGVEDCTENEALIGMGDCSNTIEEQLQGTVNDYTEIRFTTEVPNTVNSFSYNLAFFSYEYPDYYLSQFNDMYIGWLESEVWTGNISFDANGAPISLNAGFLDYRDANAPNDPECPGTCTAPELHGTCMEGHAGTAWLTTTAGVQPGETVTVVFAIFDMSDSILDSYVFLDNFEWGCDGESPPTTVPIE